MSRCKVIEIAKWKIYRDQSCLVSAEKSITSLRYGYISHATDGNDSLQTAITTPPFGPIAPPLFRVSIHPNIPIGRHVR